MASSPTTKHAYIPCSRQAKSSPDKSSTNRAKIIRDFSETALGKALLTPRTLSKEKEIHERLTEQDPCMNPEKKNKQQWSSVFVNTAGHTEHRINDNLKFVITLGTALDVLLSKASEQVKYNLQVSLVRHQYDLPTIMQTLDTMGINRHIKNENAAEQYHRDPHSDESRIIGAAVYQQLVPDDPEQLQEYNYTLEENKAKIKIAFAYHAAENNKNDITYNKLYSANMLYIDWYQQYENIKEAFLKEAEAGQINEQDITDAINIIEDYQDYVIPYECYKMIVSGTTLLNNIDGCPTVYATQKLYIEECLCPEDRARIFTGASDRIAMAMSIVDFHLPALMETIENIAEFSGYLPEKLQPNLGSVEVKENLFGKNPIIFNQEAFALGINSRMVPELHTRFRDALQQATFVIYGEKMNGVLIWNLAIEAARAGNHIRLEQLLTVSSQHPIKNSLPLIPARSTIFDFYLKRTIYDISFSRQKSSELYILLANKLQCTLPALDHTVYEKHARQLEYLRDTQFSDKVKIEMAKAFFYNASHQLGIFLVDESKIKSIQMEINSLEIQINEAHPDLANQYQFLLRKVELLRMQLDQSTTVAISDHHRPSIGKSTKSVFAQLTLATHSKKHHIESDLHRIGKTLAQLVARDRRLHELSNLIRARDEASQAIKEMREIKEKYQNSSVETKNKACDEETVNASPSAPPSAET